MSTRAGVTFHSEAEIAAMLADAADLTEAARLVLRLLERRHTEVATAYLKVSRA